MLTNWGPAGSALRKPTSTLRRGRLLSAFPRLGFPSLLLSSEDHSMRPGLSVVRTQRFAGWVEQPFVWKVTHSKDGRRTRLNESLREEHARPIRAVAPGCQRRSKIASPLE